MWRRGGRVGLGGCMLRWWMRFWSDFCGRIRCWFEGGWLDGSGMWDRSFDVEDVSCMLVVDRSSLAFVGCGV
jgi:hypothetical protein